MTNPLAALSIKQLRERYVSSAEAITPQVLDQLKNDHRQGVRQFHTVLSKRYERDRMEAARIDAMLECERSLWNSGITLVAGVDEAGTGPLAGPVVAAAVVFPAHTTLPGIDDSKRLDARQRAAAEERIRAAATGIGIGIAEVEEIDRINIYQAALTAMRRAVEALPAAPEHVLVDARTIPDIGMRQNAYIRGDSTIFSIAAASIIAKTHRDRLMAALALIYPEYGFARHKGYGTLDHRAAIRRHGPCDIHRQSFCLIPEQHPS